MRRKERYIKWNRRYKSWKIKPSRKIKKKKLFPCPTCDDLTKMEGKKFLFNPNRQTITYDVVTNFDKREIGLTNWTCPRCGKKLNYDDFPDITKDFISNLLIRNLRDVYFNPKLLTLKLKSGKEISGKVSDSGATIKTQDKSIDYICGNCNKKNMFKFIKSENPNVLQCLKCGHVNIYRPDLNLLDRLNLEN
ncbi:MAG: hypothetical protein ACFFCV_06420 [Promethearchaeota archaeon]